MQFADILATMFLGILSYIGWDYRNTKMKVEKAVTHEEVKEMIVDKLAPIEVELQAINNRLDRIEDLLSELLRR